MASTQVVTLNDIDRVLIEVFKESKDNSDPELLKVIADKLGITVTKLLQGFHTDGERTIFFGSLMGLVFYGEGLVYKAKVIAEIDKRISMNSTSITISLSIDNVSVDRTPNERMYAHSKRELLETENRVLEWVKGLLQKPKEGDTK